MNSKAVIRGLIVLMAVLSLSLGACTGMPEAPPAEQTPEPTSIDTEDDPQRRCVADALAEAERCILAGEADCKAKSESAINACG